MAMTNKTALPARAIGPAEGPPRYEGERGLSGVPTMRMHRTMRSRMGPNLGPRTPNLGFGTSKLEVSGPHFEGLRAYMPE